MPRSQYHPREIFICRYPAQLLFNPPSDLRIAASPFHKPLIAKRPHSFALCAAA